MKDTLADLKSRRSCRQYLPQQISAAELDAVLEIGTYAPTGHGAQSPVMVAVQAPEMMKRLSEVNGRIMDAKKDPFYGAPTAIIVFADTSVPTGHQDACMVMANLMHAAHALGLGSCWINRAKQMFELPEMVDLRAKWGLKPEMEGMGICILGYIPEGTVFPTKPRKDGYIVKD